MAPPTRPGSTSSTSSPPTAFVGDLPLVNFAYAPVMEVLPRKYRFRILNACMSRFIKLGLANASGRAVPFKFIANDGNFVINPILLTELDEQGIAERYDIVVDFSTFLIGDEVSGSSSAEADRWPQAGWSGWPWRRPWPRSFRSGAGRDHGVQRRRLGAERRCSGSDQLRHHARHKRGAGRFSPSRFRSWHRCAPGSSDSADPAKAIRGTRSPVSARRTARRRRPQFPWVIAVNGVLSHSFNANRISLLVPKAGEVEHWTYINDGGGWDHPIHLHFGGRHHQ